MDWFRKFMMGRYGGDQLTMVFLIISVLLSFTAGLINLPLLTLISYIPFGLGLFRMLSRNMVRRRMENEKFMGLLRLVYSRVRRLRWRWDDAEIQRYYFCRV